MNTRFLMLNCDYITLSIFEFEDINSFNGIYILEYNTISKKNNH
jgi:hypothetical protein